MLQNSQEDFIACMLLLLLIVSHNVAYFLPCIPLQKLVLILQCSVDIIMFCIIMQASVSVDYGKQEGHFLLFLQRYRRTKIHVNKCVLNYIAYIQFNLKVFIFISFNYLFITLLMLSFTHKIEFKTKLACLPSIKARGVWLWWWWCSGDNDGYFAHKRGSNGR